MIFLSGMALNLVQILLENVLYDLRVTLRIPVMSISVVFAMMLCLYSCKLAYPAETVKIIQMSEDHKIIDTAAFKSGDVPAEFAKDRSCEYLILEITGGEAVERSIPGEGENLRFFVKLTDQICVRNSIKIQ